MEYRRHVFTLHRLSKTLFSSIWWPYVAISPTVLSTHLAASFYVECMHVQGCLQAQEKDWFATDSFVFTTWGPEILLLSRATLCVDTATLCTVP